MHDMPRPRPPHLHSERSRHGKRLWYVRKGHGPRIRVREPDGSDEFWEEYRDAVAGAPRETPRVKPHTLRWAVDRYRESSAWAGLAPATRRQRENVFRRIITTAGDERLASITEDSILAGRERRKDKPHSANMFVKAMRALLKWAIEAKHIKANPASAVTMLKGPNDDNGYHAWSVEEVETYRTRWRIGTQQRLALDLLLYTGLRRGDAVRVGRQHMRDGVIQIRSEKTGEELFLPILPPLQESIDATETGDLALLVSTYKRPWVKESFGNWFRKQCDAAGLPKHCSAHGLRKAGATIAAENGATDRQLMAIFGWTTAKQASTYTRRADRKRLAADGAAKLISGADFPNLLPGSGRKAKMSGKSTL